MTADAPLTDEELAELSRLAFVAGGRIAPLCRRLVDEVELRRGQNVELRRLGEKAFAGWVDTALRRETP